MRREGREALPSSSFSSVFQGDVEAQFDSKCKIKIKDGSDSRDEVENSEAPDVI